MTEYLGVSLVVIVIALCVGILSTIVTENVLRQIEAHRKRVSDQRWAQFTKYLISFRNNYKDEINKLLTMVEKNGNKKEAKFTKDICEKLDKENQRCKENGIDLENV